jgi:hypothetical protein
MEHRQHLARTVRPLLLCGAAASLVYVSSDVVGALNYPGYDYASQAISEMSAIGAPTTELLAPFYTAFSVLFAAFAAGVWLAAGGRRSLRWSAGLLIAVAALGIVWAFFPMSMRGAGRTTTDTMHLVLSGLTMSLLAGAAATGAAAFGRTFRIYSAATVLVMIAFFGLTMLDARHIDTGATPYMGINERVSMAAWLLWIAVFSIALYRVEPARSPTPSLA